MFSYSSFIISKYYISNKRVKVYEIKNGKTAKENIYKEDIKASLFADDMIVYLIPPAPEGALWRRLLAHGHNAFPVNGPATLP